MDETLLIFTILDPAGSKAEKALNFLLFVIVFLAVSGC